MEVGLYCFVLSNSFIEIFKKGGCVEVFKSFITVKDTLPSVPLRIFPLALHALVPSFLLQSEAGLEVLFHECLFEV